jgi:hypothetical protein
MPVTLAHEVGWGQGKQPGRSPSGSLFHILAIEDTEATPFAKVMSNVTVALTDRGV